MNERLKAACDALSDDDWEDITGAMDQRNGEFCVGQADHDAAAAEYKRIYELIQALREWRTTQ